MDFFNCSANSFCFVSLWKCPSIQWHFFEIFNSLKSPSIQWHLFSLLILICSMLDADKATRYWLHAGIWRFLAINFFGHWKNVSIGLVLKPIPSVFCSSVFLALLNRLDVSLCLVNGSTVRKLWLLSQYCQGKLYNTQCVPVISNMSRKATVALYYWWFIKVKLQNIWKVENFMRYLCFRFNESSTLVATLNLVVLQSDPNWVLFIWSVLLLLPKLF